MCFRLAGLAAQSPLGGLGAIRSLWIVAAVLFEHELSVEL